MALEKRVEALEKRMGNRDDVLLIVLRFVGVNPEKMGEERAIYEEPTGYRSTTDARAWTPTAGESLLQLRERIEREVRAEGKSVYVVRECYAHEGAEA